MLLPPILFLLNSYRMATYNYIGTVTLDPFSDTYYSVLIELTNGDQAIEVVEFGNSTSVTDAEASLSNQINALWTDGSVDTLFTLNSLTITETVDTITVDIDYDVNVSVFDSLGGAIAYVPNGIAIMDQGQSTFLANGTILLQSNTPPACTPIACDECNDKVFAACEASYKIIAGLDAGTTYTVILTDRNEVRYTQDVVADGSGDLTIDAAAAEFPLGAFTPEFGGFTVEVYTDASLATKVSLVDGVYSYGCVQLSFQHTVTTTSSLSPSFNLLITDSLDFIVTEYGSTFICN